MIGLGHPPSVRTATLASAATPRRPRLLNHHVLVLVTAGRGTIDVDFDRHPCRPGTVLWMRPGQVIRYGAEPGLDAILVRWDPACLPDLPAAPWQPSDPFGPVRWQLAGEDEDAVIDEVSQLVVDCARHTGDDAAAELLHHQLAVLVLRLATVAPVDPYPAGPDASTYLTFRREVEREYVNSRQVAEYAERIGCSVRTLTRACLAAEGRSAKQVIDERVVLQAKRLLAATDLPVATIGRRLGFNEATHFCRLFHRATGHAPGSFRSRTPVPVPAPRSPAD